MNIEDIAGIVYEGSSAVAAANGLHRRIEPWKKASEDVRDALVARVKFAIENPHATPQMGHEERSADKVAKGWKRGAELSAEKRTDPSLCVWEDLPRAWRMQEEFCFAVARSLAPFIQ